MEAVTIVLNRAQVAQIVRESGRASGVAGRVGGPLEMVRLRELHEANDPRLSRSLVRGLMCLACLPNDGSTAGVVKIGVELGFSVSTTHRYCATLLDVGLLTQDVRTREYARAATTAGKRSEDHSGSSARSDETDHDPGSEDSPQDASE